MAHRKISVARQFGRLLAVTALVSGCSGTIGDPAGMGSPTGVGGSTPGGGGGSGPGVGGSGTTSGAGGGGTTTGGGGGNGMSTPCDGPMVTNTKRVIRLTFNQIANSLGSLLGDTFRTQLVTTFEIPDPTLRTFPPLGNPREGSVITDSQWQEGDSIGQAAGKYVLDNFATVTSCGATPTDACGQQFVATFAQKAFRRPLTADESTRFTKVYTDTKTAGGTVQEAVQYSVYAAVQSPLFLYRTEFGGNATADGALSPFEMATQLSMFLTDSAPDQTLLAAAAANQLSTPEQIAPHVARILATPAAKLNLESAMMAYFALPNVLSVTIDPTVAPDFTAGLANSMYHEAELFVRNVMWTGKVGDFLTSRKTTVNQGLATLYGIAFPPPGATLDADRFAPVELPATRAGVLTQAAFLTSKARPNVPSVVGRGLIVNKTIVCQENPAFPEELKAQIDAANAALDAMNASERDRAQYRAGNAPCSGCHPNFDPYGVGLLNYDVLGKFITMDSSGRPIDASITLPRASGGQMAHDAVDMAGKIDASGSFGVCMSKNLLTYAMAEGSAIYPNSCSTRAIATSFKGGDQTFASLVQYVATSQAFTTRTAGAAQ